MSELILLDGSPYVGKTTILNALEDKHKLLFWKYEKPRESALRQINFIANLYKAYFGVKVGTVDKVAMDRSPFSYWVWSQIVGITKENCQECIFTEWENVKPWLNKTILVYKPRTDDEIKKVAELRNIPYEYYKKEAEYYEHYALEKPHYFKAIILIPPNEFLTEKHLKGVLL